jgi:hypothetical protein
MKLFWFHDPMLTKLISMSSLSAIFLALPSVAAAPASMFPPDAITMNDNYGDWYGPRLEELKEKPLWGDDKAALAKETIRFTFIPGATRTAGRHATAIRIEIEEGSGHLIARTEIYHNRERSIRKVADKSLSSAEITKLKELADKADTWKFRVGTWEEPDQISIHCTELVMERRQPAGYAVSHILISCNKPDRLMPLVDYVAELAGQRREELRY